MSRRPSNERPDPLAGELLLRPREAAALLRITLGTVRSMVRRGELRALRVGQVLRLDAAQVRRRAANRAGCGS